MSNSSKIPEQDIENTNGKDFLEATSNDNLELFKRALLEAMESKIRKIEEDIKDISLDMKLVSVTYRGEKEEQTEACSS